MDKINLLIMCANLLRHRYFAIRLLKEIDNSFVLIENVYDDTSRSVTAPTQLQREHFLEFEETEEKYFKDYVEQNQEFLKSRILLTVKKGAINDNENIEFIKKLNPKVIAVHGTALIKDELISLFPGRIINLHAGLSPYYRGSGTNIYPFFNNELEYVGMTVHYIDIGIDSGDIILQGRPGFEPKDNTHTIGCKNVILGTDLMIKTIQQYLKEGSLPAFKQDKTKGKLYLQKYFTDDVVQQIRKNISEGMVEKYVKNPKRVELVNW